MALLTDRTPTDSWYTRTVQSLFRENCSRLAEQPAIFYRDRTWTFADLGAEVDALTAEFMRRGIGRGDVVSVLPAPTPAFAILYFAALQTGATINPLNLMWSGKELAAVLVRNRPRVVVAIAQHGGRDMLQLVEESVGEQTPLLIAVGGGGPDGGSDASGDGQGCGQWEALETLRTLPATAAEREQIEARVNGSRASDVQFICQTSGSTGISKSALWNHRSPLATAHFSALALGVDDDDRYVNLAPFYHNSGICSSLVMCLAYAGISLQLFDSFDPDEALKAMEERNLTVTFGFAAHWTALKGASEYSRDDFTIRRAMLAGDSAVHREVIDMCRPGTVLANLYAQTENGPLVSVTERHAVDPALRTASNGRPLAGVELLVRDLDDGSPVPNGVMGEICYRSPFMFEGYLMDDGAVHLPLDEDGYFQSGDVGRMQGGYLTFVERLGNVVKSGGENVSLARVTQEIRGVLGDDVDDVQAIAIPHDFWGSMVVGLVRPGDTAPGTQLDRNAFRDRCRSVLAGYEIPQAFLAHPDAWPVSPEGKLHLKKLQQFAVDALAGSPAMRSKNASKPKEGSQ